MICHKPETCHQLPTILGVVCLDCVTCVSLMRSLTLIVMQFTTRDDRQGILLRSGVVCGQQIDVNTGATFNQITDGTRKL